MIITAPFTTLQASSIKASSVVISLPVTTLDNGKITVILKGEIRARISALFKWVRSQVRTENRLLKLVSSLVSTENILLNSVSTLEVSSQVSTEKATYNHAHQERKIFSLASNQDFSTVTTRAREAKDYHRISKVFTKIGKVNSEFSGMLGREFCQSIKKAYQIVFRVHKKGNYLADLANFSRQVAITQAEKLVFSFFAIASICSISSWGKRIFFNCDLLFLLPVTIIQSLMFKLLGLINSNKKWLTCLHTKLYIGIYTPNEYFRLYKTIAQRVCTSMSYLTQPLTGVMIMANRYDSAHLRVEQSKLFTFYNGLTSQLVRTIAITDQQARQKLSNINLTFISRKPLAMGVNHGK